MKSSVTKICKGCLQEKDLSQFYPKKRYKYGVDSRCNKCRCAEVKKAAPKYAEKTKASQKMWQANNKDYVKQQRKASYDAIKHNPEFIAKNKAKAKTWFESNKDKRKEYKKLNAGKVRSWDRVSSLTRRARIKNCQESFTVKQVTELHQQQSYVCNICKCCINHKYHVDHIMPLKLGGGNGIDNIQLLCPTCNLKKGAKHPDTFMQELGLFNFK
jgi:5-methylcytosine-specific restriction endonuclease McrA